MNLLIKLFSRFGGDAFVLDNFDRRFAAELGWLVEISNQLLEVIHPRSRGLENELICVLVDGNPEQGRLFFPS